MQNVPEQGKQEMPRPILSPNLPHDLARSPFLLLHGLRCRFAHLFPLYLGDDLCFRWFGFHSPPCVAAVTISRSSVRLAILPTPRSSASDRTSVMPSQGVRVRPRPTRRRKVMMRGVYILLNSTSGRASGRRVSFLASGSWGRWLSKVYVDKRVEKCGDDI